MSDDVDVAADGLGNGGDILGLPGQAVRLSLGRAESPAAAVHRVHAVALCQRRRHHRPASARARAAVYKQQMRSGTDGFVADHGSVGGSYGRRAGDQSTSNLSEPSR
ncbi:hypothetical protein AWC26_11540 [Mycobacterium shimoidei]|nr:hypothetical protein BHQ16_05865 [Mycobacterium shimoidei]ORW80506.1 hypothetical protein AWC26_11540 [Mycobacterium shimoidei]